MLASLPTGRGFDSYLGYWSGAEDYYSHVCKAAYDFADGTRTALKYNNTYSTPVFTQRVVDIVSAHAKDPALASTPWYMYLAFQNIHWPLEAPQNYIDMYADIATGAQKICGGCKSPKDGVKRQTIAAMIKIMDDGIGNITVALKSTNQYDDTFIVFSSDNGGPTHNNEGTQSNNYPLRGGKNTIWEGGTRLLGIVKGHKGSGIAVGQNNYEMIHGTDWLPTIVTMASGDDWHKLIPANEPPQLLGDGMNVWPALVGKPSPRTEMVLECHSQGQPQVHGNAFIMQQDNTEWKIIQNANTNNEAGWYPPPAQNVNTTKYTVQCPGPKPSGPDSPGGYYAFNQSWTCRKAFCLFNVTIGADTCEYHDLAAKHPDVVAKMVKRLKDYQATAVLAVTDKDGTVDCPDTPTCKKSKCEPVVDAAGAWRPCDSPSSHLLGRVAGDVDPWQASKPAESSTHVKNAT